MWEAAYSWRRLAEESKSGAATPIPEPVFPAMVALHAAWLLGCFVEVAVRRPEFHAEVVLPLLLLWGLALGLRFWVMISLGDCWNVRLIKRKKQPIIVSGPYRYIRHPNYVAVILEIAVVPLLVGAWWTALLGSLANGLVLWKRIAWEERQLMQESGYRKAFSDKARLIPGVF